jgi:hypothetical protein
MMKSGHIRKNITKTELEFMIAQINFITRFWIPDAGINLSEYKEVNWYYYYLNFLSSVLAPFLNKKGKDEMDDFLTNFKRV